MALSLKGLVPAPVFTLNSSEGSIKMPQPINYLTDIKSPLDRALEGYKFGAAVRQDRQQQQDRESKMQAIESQKQRASQLQSDMYELSKNPTLDAIQSLTIKYPEVSKDYKDAYASLNTEQQDNQIKNMAPIYSALKNGKVDVAKQILETQRLASENSGLDTGGIDIMLKQIDISPEAVLSSSKTGLVSMLGVDKFKEIYGDEKINTEKLKAKFGIAKDFSEDFTMESIDSAIKSKDLSKLKPKSLTEGRLFNESELKVLNPFVEKFQMKTEFKDARDAFNKANDVKNLLGKDEINPVADSAAIAKLARVITGPGVLTESDKASVVGDKSLLTEFTRVIKKAKDGIILDKDRQWMIKASDLMQEKASLDLNNFLNSQSDSFSIRNTIDRERIDKVVDPFRLAFSNKGNSKDPDSKQPPPSVDPSQIPEGATEQPVYEVSF